MSHAPSVSVIIPVYNGADYLAESIESVLAQDREPLELMVVDDCSDDGSDRVARRFPGVHYHCLPRLGLAAARNYGADIARGDFLAFLDADDVWLPLKTSLQVRVLEEDPDVDMVFGHVRQFHSPDLDDAARARLQGDGEVLPGYFAGTLVIRKEAFFRAGQFEIQWRVGEFIDWYIRALDKGLAGRLLPQVVTKRRLHRNNASWRKRDCRGDYVRIVKASLDRRRALAAMPDAPPGVR